MKRLPAVLLALFAAVPLLAAIAPDVTLPVTGKIILPGDIAYNTELTITNHRDVLQQVIIQWIDGEFNGEFVAGLTLAPGETIYRAAARHTSFYGKTNKPGALRFVAASQVNDFDYVADPNGRLEVSATIVKFRGPFGLDGSSRQEVEGVPSTDYLAKEAVFVGLHHEEPTYTNVGVVNLSSTETVTYFIRYGEDAPIELTVPPRSNLQMRIPGPFAQGTHVRIQPEWALLNGTPTPWVAYASTVDGYTGDAFSGVRIPSNTIYRR